MAENSDLIEELRQIVDRECNSEVRSRQQLAGMLCAIIASMYGGELLFEAMSETITQQCELQLKVLNAMRVEHGRLS